jgi:hypothetical protein
MLPCVFAADIGEQSEGNDHPETPVLPTEPQELNDKEPEEVQLAAERVPEVGDFRRVLGQCPVRPRGRITLLLHDIVGRVPDHDVKPSAVDDLRELGAPIEWVDLHARVFVEETQLLAGVVVGPDQRVPALDVLAQVGERAGVEHLKLKLECLPRLALEHL